MHLLARVSDIGYAVAAATGRRGVHFRHAVTSHNMT